MLMPILGDMAHAKLAALPYAGFADVMSHEGNAACRDFIKACQRVYELGLSVAFNARKADYLAALYAERNILDRIALMKL